MICFHNGRLEQGNFKTYIFPQNSRLCDDMCKFGITFSPFKMSYLLHLIFLVFSGFTYKASVITATDSGDLPCSNVVYCHGNLLDTVQRMKMFNDSKTFVDLPLKSSPESTINAFDVLVLTTDGNLNKSLVQSFLDEHFISVDVDLPAFPPPDWQNVTLGGLPIFDDIKDPTLRDFAAHIHNKWLKLGRKIDDRVRDYPDQNSLIYVPNPFVVPGGRFREIYYWDSYWVIQGLLVSNMTETAKGMIKNFAYLIDKLGHVPNGNRIYYTKRSQPPFLALILDQYIQHKNVPTSESAGLVQEILPFLEKEYDFWMEKRRIVVEINRTAYTLNVYKGGMNSPRPESYREDLETAENHKSHQSKDSLFTNIAAAAESGWDFSTRWLDEVDSDFTTIRTESIVPVDLNAILCAQENLMSKFYTMTGNHSLAEKYRDFALNRGDAMRSVFWNESRSMWLDYDTHKNQHRPHFYLSHVTPVFADCNGRYFNVTATKFLQQLIATPDMQRLTEFPGGFPASFVSSAKNCCQWDFPNAWPPLQMMLIEGFAANTDVRDTALVWAQKWISAVYHGFSNRSQFYEKYDVRNIGGYGGGGEYEVQEGFGWTNGGVLRLLELFPDELAIRSSAAAIHLGTSLVVVFSLVGTLRHLLFFSF